MNETEKDDHAQFIERNKHDFINHFNDTVQRLRIDVDQIKLIDPSRAEHIHKMWAFLNMMSQHLQWLHCSATNHD